MAETHTISPASTTVAATGGPDPGRTMARRWWCHLDAVLRDAVGAVAAPDPLGRRPVVAVSGRDARLWCAHLASSVTAAPLHRTVDGSADLVVALDDVAHREPDDAQERLRGLAAAARPGGRVLLVDRVVARRPGETIGIDELLDLAVRAFDLAVTLDDVRSLVRPGEHTRSTAVLRLVRLATDGLGEA